MRKMFAFVHYLYLLFFHRIFSTKMFPSKIVHQNILLKNVPKFKIRYLHSLLGLLLVSFLMFSKSQNLGFSDSTVEYLIFVYIRMGNFKEESSIDLWHLFNNAPTLDVGKKAWFLLLLEPKRECSCSLLSGRITGPICIYATSEL